VRRRRTTELDCGHPPTRTRHAFTNGIARTAGGWTMCYPCAYDEQVVELLVRDTVDGYIAARPRERPGLRCAHTPFTTWPGQRLGSVVSLRYSRPRRSRQGAWRMRYVLVRDLHGQLWRGHGSDQYDLIRLHKVHCSITSGVDAA
jgi:hypothetical protein